MTKLAGPFLYENSLCDEFIELNIKFDKEQNDFTKLIEFVNEYSDRRINIKMKTLDVSLFKKLVQFNKNIYARLEWRNCYEVVLDELKSAGVRFFFDKDFPASDMISLSNLISFGVSDVYIGDSLMYNLPDVSKFCHSRGVKMRVVLNEITSFWGQGRNPKDMFFRPEDYDILDTYFDIFEFDCEKDRIPILKKVWLEDKRWIGDLRAVHDGVRFHIPNGSLSPNFTNKKISCGRKCDYVENFTCNRCNQLMEVAQTLSSKGAVFR